eukprot:scaffold111224_cov57-Phaeocystis_antarctica.AAC.1
MALNFVTIHPSLNMTTRLVGPRPQPTTRTPWPLRPDLSSQRWRPHARPVLPLFRVYNIIRGKTGYTHSLSPSRPPNNTLNTQSRACLFTKRSLWLAVFAARFSTRYMLLKHRDHGPADA